MSNEQGVLVRMSRTDYLWIQSIVDSYCKTADNRRKLRAAEGVKPTKEPRPNPTMEVLGHIGMNSHFTLEVYDHYYMPPS